MSDSNTKNVQLQILINIELFLKDLMGLTPINESLFLTYAQEGLAIARKMKIHLALQEVVEEEKDIISAKKIRTVKNNKVKGERPSRNKEVIKEKSRIYYLKNKEILDLKAKDYALKNKQKVRAAKQDWYRRKKNARTNREIL